MRTISIAGRVGKDAELRRTQDGTPVLSFSVAVDDGRGDAKKTLWFDCSVFGNRGASLEKHVTKGSQISVSGEFSTREHAGKTYLQVRVNDLSLQGGGQQRTATGHSTRTDDRDYEGEMYGRGEDDGEIPF